MGILSYDGKKIVPAPPGVTIQKRYITTGDGKRIGAGFDISIVGELVAYKGSPDSNGTFWTSSGYPPDESITDSERLESILRKQEALRDLFSNEGKSLELQADNGSSPLKCNPRVKGISYQNGRWHTTCQYTIELEASIIYINGTALGEDDSDLTDYHISSFDESWNLEITDEDSQIYRLTHNISANGTRFFNEAGVLVQESWQNARDYVLNRIQLGLDTTKLTASGVLNQDNFQAFNYIRTQNINEAAGTFAVTENWSCFVPSGSFAAVEDYTISVRSSIQDPLTTASIEGNVRGFERRNNTNWGLITTKYMEATGAFLTDVIPNVFSRVQGVATGVTLTSRPANITYSENRKTGVINYSREFNNRPSPNVSGALSEVVSITWDNPGKVIAKIPILNRVEGPLLQDIGTYTGRTKNVTIELVMPVCNPVNGDTFPDTDDYIVFYEPDGTYYLTRDQETFSGSTGRYTRQLTWEYEL